MIQLKFRAWHTQQKKMFSAEEMAEDQLTLLPTGQFINVSGNSTRLSTIFPIDILIPMEYSQFNDKDDIEIYEGDIIELVNYLGETIRVLCEKGIARREINGIAVDISGFYFLTIDGAKTFPVVINYMNVHDTAIFKVIGNIYENPDLITILR